MTTRLLAAAAVLLVLAAPARGADPARPNVLFLMSDDMRPDLGCYGHPIVKSPNLDALAAAGVRFERAYCQYPLCNPSRTSLLTGRHPRTTGVTDNTTYFRDVHPKFVTLPQLFKAHGYATLRAGKIFHGGIDDVASWTEGGQPRPVVGEDAPKTKQARQNPLQSDRIVVLPGDGRAHADARTADRALEFLRDYRD